jgi:transcriptional regulator with XRE-family HTH domain
MTDDRQHRLGRLLTEWREQAGLSQTELARCIVYDRTTVNHAERGHRVPAAEFWQACDQVLGADGALRTLYEQWQEAKPRRAGTTRQRTPHRVAALQSAALDELPGRMGILTSESDFMVNSDEDPVMAAARESARFSSFAEATNVGPLTLEQLRADIDRIARTWWNRPVISTFVEARELRDRAFELLEGHQQPPQTRDLYLAAGLLCSILAEASLGLGNLAAAETQARTAFLCAELAGHNGLRCWVRGEQSMIAIWDGRPADAVALARSGWDYVPETGTARVRPATIEARAQALLGHADAVDDALDRAKDARQQVVGSDEVGGFMESSVAEQLFYASTANLRIGGEQRYRQVEHDATEAIRLYEAEPTEVRRLSQLVETRLDLAGARLASGDLEGCAEQASEAMRASARRRTFTLDGRLRQLAGRLALAPYRSTPMALGLREEIQTYATAGQARALPVALEE